MYFLRNLGELFSTIFNKLSINNLSLELFNSEIQSSITTSTPLHRVIARLHSICSSLSTSLQAAVIWNAVCSSIPHSQIGSWHFFDWARYKKLFNKFCLQKKLRATTSFFRGVPRGIGIGATATDGYRVSPRIIQKGNQE